jgi:hypothetical protein
MEIDDILELSDKAKAGDPLAIKAWVNEAVKRKLMAEGYDDETARLLGEQILKFCTFEVEK